MELIFKKNDNKTFKKYKLFIYLPALSNKYKT